MSWCWSWAWCWSTLASKSATKKVGSSRSSATTLCPSSSCTWPIVGCCCNACCTFLQTWALTIRRAAVPPLFRRCLGHVRSQPHNPGKNQRAKKILVYHPPPSQYGCKLFNCTCAKTDDLSIYGTAPDGQTFNCLHWFYVKQGCTKELYGTDQWL